MFSDPLCPCWFEDLQLMQLKHNRTSLLIVYLPLLILLAALALQTSVKISHLTEDTVFVLDGEVYVGIISDVSIYLWVAATSICFIGGTVLGVSEHKHQERNFLYVMGCFTLFLTVDDRILLHDHLIDGGEAIYAVYVLFMIVALYHFRSLLSSDYSVLLFLALFLLGVSVGSLTCRQSSRGGQRLHQ